MKGKITSGFGLALLQLYRYGKTEIRINTKTHCFVCGKVYARCKCGKQKCGNKNAMKKVKQAA